ncbi:unnamed protein product [Sympodiomycopsis kandeliae]
MERSLVQGKEQLEKFRINIPASAYREGPPPQSSDGQDGFFYIPNFVTEQEENYLLDKIATAPQPKWKTLQNRRLQYWGGQVSSKNTLIPQQLPEFMTRFPPLLQTISNTGAFTGSAHNAPNHCLVNEYLPGQGIMPHEDGDAYFSAVATVSLGSHTMLDIYRWATEDNDDEVNGKIRAREQEPIFSILQEPRSLLITTGSAYKNFLHGIAERSREEAKHLAKVVNVNQVWDENLKKQVIAAMKADRSGEKLDDVLIREDRISLTFRDVEKVSKGLGGLLNKK